MESLRLEIKRKLTARSDRVKCVDQHPTEPWLLCSLYNGDVNIWNYETHVQIKRFEVCDQPVRAAKFVPRKNWVITGSDDMQIRVFNYNTLDRVHAFEAHSDYVRCIAVHPTQPYILTSSDDLLIKLWNWDRNWACQQVFEGHTHYVMQVVINPKDNNTFASASLDTTVKVWQLGSSSSNFSLEGHEKGVNCVDYYHGGDKPYLISGADDRLVKIWDYQNKTCVQTLESHAQNVSAVCFHPEVPILLTGSEDGSIRIWHAGTYRLKTSVNYGFERVWTISAMHGSNNVAIGYDEGTIMIKIGREEPAISMDVNGGKIIWAKHSEIQQVNLKALPEGTEIKDGERVPVVAKDLGACEIYPQTLAHNPNGRFVVVCGDGEYIIYTAMALRNKAFGNAQEFVWAFDSSEYATLENSSTVKVFRNFKERHSFKPEYGAEGIFGGHMLGVKSINGLAFSFYDWERLEHIRRIEIQPKSVYWSESGNLVCLATEDAYFVLQYNAAVVTQARQTFTNITEDGIEDAFEVVGEVNETVKTGLWVGDCFIYTNSLNRLNYYVGGEIVTVSHLDHTMYILGYVAKENRLYLNDKELNIVSYSLLLCILEYQTAVMRGDFETADRILPTVPHEHRTRIAHFLEKQGFKQQALAVSTEPEHQFELALSLGELERARQLAEEAATAEGAPSRTASARWARLGAAAAAAANTDLTKVCYQNAKDLSALLLFSCCTGDEQLLGEVADTACDEGTDNVAFISYLLLDMKDRCLEMLLARKRFAEAAFFARSYLPSRVTEVVHRWRESLGADKKAGQSLADPDNYENLFPEYQESLELEKFMTQYGPVSRSMTSIEPNAKLCSTERNLEEERQRFQSQRPSTSSSFDSTPSLPKVTPSTPDSKLRVPSSQDFVSPPPRESAETLPLPKSQDFVSPPPRTENNSEDLLTASKSQSFVSQRKDSLGIDDIDQELKGFGIVVNADETKSLELQNFLAQYEPVSRSMTSIDANAKLCSTERNLEEERQHFQSLSFESTPSLPKVTPSTPDSKLRVPSSQDFVSPPPRESVETLPLPKSQDFVSPPPRTENNSEDLLTASKSQSFVSQRKDSLGIDDIDQELKGFGIVVNADEMQSLELEKFMAQYGPVSRSMPSIEANAKLCSTERNLEEERQRFQSQRPSTSSSFDSTPSLPKVTPSTPDSKLRVPSSQDFVSPPPRESVETLPLPKSQDFVSPPPRTENNSEDLLTASKSQSFVSQRKDSLGIDDIDQELKGFGIVVNADKTESLELEKFMAQYETVPRSMTSIDANAKLCSTERNLEEERQRFQPQRPSTSSSFDRF